MPQFDRVDAAPEAAPPSVTSFSLPASASSAAAALLAAVEHDLQRLMRELADSRAAAAEREHAHRSQLRKLLLALLGTLDAFERVFVSMRAKDNQMTPQIRTWAGNFRVVRRRLEDIVKEHGVVAIERLEDEFDPRWHSCVETVTNDAKADGTVVEEIQKGYLWHDELLRRAEVVVVRND